MTAATNAGPNCSISPARRLPRETRISQKPSWRRFGLHSSRWTTQRLRYRLGWRRLPLGQIAMKQPRDLPMYRSLWRGEPGALDAPASKPFWRVLPFTYRSVRLGSCHCRSLSRGLVPTPEESDYFCCSTKRPRSMRGRRPANRQLSYKESVAQTVVTSLPKQQAPIDLAAGEQFFVLYRDNQDAMSASFRMRCRGWIWG